MNREMSGAGEIILMLGEWSVEAMGKELTPPPYPAKGATQPDSA
jgi:hypothetical protein